MPTDEFEENRGFLQLGQDERVDADIFKEFAAQHGPETVKGYIMAIKDQLPLIEEIFETPNNVRKREMAWKLIVYMRGLLQLHSDLDSNANIAPPNP